MMEDDIPDCVQDLSPSREEVERLLSIAGAPVLPSEVGLTGIYSIIVC